MKFKEIDWSSDSMPRRILDMNIFMGFAVIVGYFLEHLDNHPTVQVICMLWLAGIGLWLMTRIIDFGVTEKLNSKEAASSNEETVQMELDEETERVLIMHACENKMTLSQTVTQALEEYLVHVKETKATNATERQ